MPEVPVRNDVITLGMSVPKQDHIPIPVTTALLIVIFFYA